MSLTNPITLIVGLGNPGPEYENTRHNAGAWLVEQLAEQYHAPLRFESKFHGLSARISPPGANEKIHLLIPTTYMNHSGQAVKALSQFYKIQPNQILVAHDELDLNPGTARLKNAGGHGGHNGLRDIQAHLGTNAFLRLRLGIGHPGDKSKVVNFVLKPPGKAEQELIQSSIEQSLAVLPDLFKAGSGVLEKAMKTLHTA